MKIKDIYQKHKPVISFELFPPKKDGGIDIVYQTLEELKDVKPDFISVTYGAGGSLASNKTLEVASIIKNQYGIEPLHHLACIASTKEEVNALLEDIKAEGIDNVLALRGDLPNGCQHTSPDFTYAKDLIGALKSAYDFSIGAACYPEGHIDQLSSRENMAHMREKEEAGADFFISQLFFQNDCFYRMADNARNSGITAPISAGIMPILSRSQVEKMIFMCGASLPSELIKLIHKYESNIQDLRKAGLEYAMYQMEDLLAHGVDGVHIYAMNRAEVARTAMRNLRGA